MPSYSHKTGGDAPGIDVLTLIYHLSQLVCKLLEHVHLKQLAVL